jgi:hypothetical protein
MKMKISICLVLIGLFYYVSTSSSDGKENYRSCPPTHHAAPVYCFDR